MPAAAASSIIDIVGNGTITNNGDSVHFWGAQAEYKWLSSYMPQRAALKDKYEIVDYIDNASGQVFDPIAGRIEVTCTGFAATVDGPGCFIFDTACGVSFESRILQQREATLSTYRTDTQQYDTAGALVAQLQAQVTTLTAANAALQAKIDAAKADAGVGRRRAQRQLDALAAVQANADGLGQGLEGALPEHA